MIIDQNKQGNVVDVTVILPTYNRISMLDEALSSALDQNYDGIVEIIIVDDNSQDGTSEFISQKYPEVHLIILEKNVGAYATRNLALKQANGKFIAFLDSDDLWKSHYLKTQLSALNSSEHCFSVSGLLDWDILHNIKVMQTQRPNLQRFTSPIHHLLSDGSFIFTPTSVVFPYKIFEEVGFFDETLRMAGDTDFYLRCLLAGYKPIFTELPTVIRRKHGKDQLTNIENYEARKANRLERACRYYPLVSESIDIVPLTQIYAEIHAHFSSRYFYEKCYIKWLANALNSARYSPYIAISRMFNDIGFSLKRKLKNKFDLASP
jgi:glycosyltransferase involved in cell wall biosynthesis